MRKRKEEKPFDADILLGIVSILLVLLSIILMSGMLGAGGDAGDMMYKSLSLMVGILAYVTPVVLCFAAYMIWFKKSFSNNYLKYTGVFLLLISLMGVLNMTHTNLAGALGNVIASPLITHIGTVPALLTLLSTMYVSLMILTERRAIISWAKKVEEDMTEEELVEHKKPTVLHKMFSGVMGLITGVNFKKRDTTPFAEIDEEYEESEEEIAEKLLAEKSLRGVMKKELHIVDESENNEVAEVVEKLDLTPKKAFRLDVEFIPPPLDLLNGDKGRSSAGDTKAVSRSIQNVLNDFEIQVEMSGATVGPTVTQYRIKPPQGVPVRRILTLKDDIQLALSVDNIHIEAPIPGKPYVGIEVPNKDKQQLGLRDMLDTPEFKNSGNLTVAIGKSITNTPVYGDIENMPHLLIAGATKSGKSVTVQNIIMSLLYKNSPDALRLIVIDPKKVEFTLYKNLPHLSTPVITTPQNAIKCLKWAIDEMDRRYDYFADEYAGIQNLADYHKKILYPAMEKVKRYGKIDQKMPERMPYIVIIFDEFNDFMLTYPKEITTAITSLTQKGRAAGIHLILATQRPDVKVITGTIKANIPARIALKTSSSIDSRTILDQTGAEDLLGRGDMLFMDPGEARPFRVQAPFVSSEEIKSVIDYIKNRHHDYENEQIDYNKVSVDSIASSGNLSSNDNQNVGDMDYAKAKEYVIATQRASASGLQSKFGWGFPKANGMVMKLETAGIITPLESNNKRRVLVNLNQVEKNDDTLDEIFDEETDTIVSKNRDEDLF